MIKKIVYFSIAALLLSACSSNKSTTKTASVPPTPPEGIEFTKIENYKDFKVINYPYVGKGFKKNNDVDVDRNRNDADEFIPGVKFEGSHVSIWSSVGDKDGDLDFQFEVLKKKLLRPLIKDESQIIFEKKKVGNQNVAFIKITTLKSSGYVNFTYGCLIAYNNKAALLLVRDAMISSTQMQEYEATLESAFKYMIKTVEFK